MKCLILAAGYATRLYPLTENFPKPLLKVQDKTILDWYKTLAKIRKHKVFKDGKMTLVEANNGLIVYKRDSKDESVIVISNLNSEDYYYQDNYKYKSLIDNNVYDSIKVSSNHIDILIKVK